MYVIPGSVRKMGARKEAALGAYSANSGVDVRMGLAGLNVPMFGNEGLDVYLLRQL